MNMPSMHTTLAALGVVLGALIGCTGMYLMDKGRYRRSHSDKIRASIGTVILIIGMASVGTGLLYITTNN